METFNRVCTVILGSGRGTTHLPAVKRRTVALLPPPPSGWDHAFAALPVGHGAPIVISPGSFAGFFLSALLYSLPALAAALGVTRNSGRIVWFVPAEKRKGGKWV